jgi:hypothetical protein
MADAFATAVKSALHNYGHRGYTGTIAEKDIFVEIQIPKDFMPKANRVERAKAWAKSSSMRQTSESTTSGAPPGAPSWKRRMGRRPTYSSDGRTVRRMREVL